MKIIDITQELFSCHVFPGDTPPTFERVRNIENDSYNLTNISLCVHNGTHIDAPNHFIAGGKAVHELDLERFYGKCTVIEPNEITAALRNLTHWSDPLFRKKSREIEKFDERLWELLDDMRETLEAVNGYGCAAVHIGVLQRAVVILDKDGLIELVNPVIIESSEEKQSVLEGSIAPGAPRGHVTRPKSVTVSAFDRHGKPITVSGSDFLAATLCHELDHLDGILFTEICCKEELIK
jgi:peptide deformylase